jgi:hypothetical protein
MFCSNKEATTMPPSTTPQTKQSPPRQRPFRRVEPFKSAEEAWFWTVRALEARREGANGGDSPIERPCDPDDILRCLDRLYRTRRIELLHARVLRIWGDRQRAPDPKHPRERSDCRLWREVMDRLAWKLRDKGIVE